MKRLPRMFLSARPKLLSPVHVHGVTDSSFRAVVIAHSTTEPEFMTVMKLSNRSEWNVSFRQCTHATK